MGSHAIHDSYSYLTSMRFGLAGFRAFSQDTHFEKRRGILSQGIGTLSFVGYELFGGIGAFWFDLTLEAEVHVGFLCAVSFLRIPGIQSF